MEQGGDPNLLTKPPANSASSQDETCALNLQVPTPHSLVLHPHSVIRKTRTAMFYSRNRSSKFFEAKKIDEMRQTAILVGKTAEQSLKVYSRMRFSKLCGATEIDDTCRTANFVSKTPSQSDKECFNSMKYGKYKSVSTVEISKMKAKKDNSGCKTLTSNTDKTSTGCSLELAESSEEKFFNDVKHGKYQKRSMVNLLENTLKNGGPVPTLHKEPKRARHSSMSELFDRTFDKEKPMQTDEEGIPENSRMNSNPNTNQAGLNQGCPDYTRNNDTTIEFTDSMTNVCKLFSNFVGEKARLLRCIGFDGLCTFPVHETSDLNFYIWILTKVDARRSTLDLGTSRRIPIHDNDISLITGLPCRGHPVIRNERSPLVKRTHAAVVKKLLSMGKNDAMFTVPYVESVVKREYNSPMSDQEKFGFCIAATVYAISSFLALEAGNIRFPFEIINSLVDPLEIKSHNWCQLVRKCYLSQAIYVQNQIRRGDKNIKVGGCPFIAKVHYLDNLQFGAHIVPDYIFPRGSLYTQELVHKLINMDTTINDQSFERQYGNHEFKRDYEVCYTRAIMDAVPIRIAPPVANKQFTHHNEEPNLQAQKEIEARESAVNHIGRQLTVGEMILNAHQKLLNRKAGRPIGNVVYPLSRHAGNLQKNFDLNVAYTGEESNASGENNPQEDADNTTNLMEVSNMNGLYEDKLWKCMRFYNRVTKKRTHDLQCIMWYEHKEPYMISISGDTCVNEAARGHNYGKDYTDAVIRMLTTLEDSKYLGTRKREKHYMAYSWSYDVLQGSQVGGVEESKKFFISKFYNYDIDKCNKIVVIVNIEGNTSCYIWDFLDGNITVLDPVMMSSTISSIKALHEEYVLFLNDSLVECIQEFYPEWNVNLKTWKILYKNDISKRCRQQNSGLYATHYAQFYNANKLELPIDNTDLGEFRGRHLWEVITMEGNTGAVPVPLSIIKAVDGVKTRISYGTTTISSLL